MTGMGGSNGNDPAVVHAFHQTLLYQGFIVAGLLVLVLVTGSVLRSRQLRQAQAQAPEVEHDAHDAPARRLLRIGFGLLWVVDGVLQGQVDMPQHLVPQVILPASEGQPGWVVSLVHDVTTVWEHHQATAAAATVWIQIGLGLWLLVAPRGRWSRLAGVASAAWAAVIWSVGESFGGIFGSGLSWLEGAPGAALLYLAAGTLIAVPDNYWITPKPGLLILRTSGAVLLAGAVLQAWPGRHASTDLADMTHKMAATPQPGWLHDIVGGVADHSGPAGAVATIAMAALGLALLAAGPPRAALTRAAVATFTAFGLAVWVTIQDLGVLGGVGTDPNSMIPWIVLVGAGAVAITKPALVTAGGVPSRRTDPAYALRTVAAAASVAVTLVGALPLTGDAVSGAGAPPGKEYRAAVPSNLGCLPCNTSPGACTAR